MEDKDKAIKLLGDTVRGGGMGALDPVTTRRFSNEAYGRPWTLYICKSGHLSIARTGEKDPEFPSALTLWTFDTREAAERVRTTVGRRVSLTPEGPRDYYCWSIELPSSDENTFGGREFETAAEAWEGRGTAGNEAIYEAQNWLAENILNLAGVKKEL